MSGQALTCSACGAELPAAFPGGSVACGCGHRVEVAGLAAARAPSNEDDGGPYRAASSPVEVAPNAKCPFCGNECPPMVRICPHCDVRLENVRCRRCFSLQAPGAFACTRCRHPLELEPTLDATDAPCPRCRHPLEAAPGSLDRAHECPRCGGILVPRDALAEILAAAEVGGALREPPPKRVMEAAVHYVSCPQCHCSMNRVRFGKLSGVIVDVCMKHGTWFDAGELTRVIAFAAAGGLVKETPGERTRDAVWRDYLVDLFEW